VLAVAAGSFPRYGITELVSKYIFHFHSDPASAWPASTHSLEPRGTTVFAYTFALRLLIE
jgi:hypothetical protein